MKTFIKNSFLLVFPFIMYLALIVFVDPYNYLETSRTNSKKCEIAENIEPHLFRIIKFQNFPKNNIALGDSRVNDFFENFDSNKWSNLSYGGGSLKEVIQSFWWAVDEAPIDTVFIGLNLNLYNKYNKRFWVEETLERKKNLISYAFNKYTFKSTWLLLKSRLIKKEIVWNELKLTKDEFWEYQLNEAAFKFYSRFEYPTNYFQELKKISQYCKSQNIELIFFIPPTYIGFQNRKIDFSLTKFDQKFVADLESLGKLYNYDVDSEMTRDGNNFKDPMHFNHQMGKRMYKEIFSREVH